ncbi:hypothetical protein [Streptomyces griseoloalbus]|uniref:Uncharacterized protein n=1 Tax=Streptomyces griseoloalbus TaxID=67303 RepID=A0A7W8BRA8_9ACTN|nr:hypothetical protein [Streptomyces albaduncus]
MSGPTVAVDQRASTNGVGGRGSSSAASKASNTVIGAAPPSGRHFRRPATCRLQVTASACMCLIELNSRPRQNESRT